MALTAPIKKLINTPRTEITRAGLDKLVSAWRKAREKRLAAEKKIEPLKNEEALLKEMVMDVLLAQQFDGAVVGGRVTSLTSKDIMVADDPAALSAYILESKQLDLLQFRISPKAIQERLDAGITVPGIGTVKKYDLSDRALK